MADDLANKWGCNLRLSSSDTRRKSMEGNCFKRLGEAVRKSTKGKFVLTKALSCGSDANAFAVLEATTGDTSRIGIAAGSYVAGDNGSLQVWSSSAFDVKSALAIVKLPKEVAPFTEELTFALPYRIPCRLCDLYQRDTKAYEDYCLTALHARLLFARLMAWPFNSILMELILGGNGCALSERALCKLAKILKHHKMSCVVDECLTGGRCGPGMLLTQSMPLEFQQQVTHITLAKWPGIGMVLATSAMKRDTTTVSTRRQSTKTDCNDATKMWLSVEKGLSKIPGRRQTVVKALRLGDEGDSLCWGTGLLMFGPKQRCDALQGLKNRYLPLLEETDVDRIKFIRPDNYEKESVCELMRSRIDAWVDNYVLIAERQGSRVGINGRLCWLLCVELAKPKWKGIFFRAETMKDALDDDEVQVDLVELRAVLVRAERQCLIIEIKKGKQRRRGYLAQAICHISREISTE